MKLHESKGAPIVLGSELGRGGEGAVYELPARPEAVAKIYLKPPDRSHAEKLAVMVAVASESILKLAAWPLSTLHDESGSVVGFTMPRLSGLRPVFNAYGPKLRLKHYPKADWRFLVRAAANSARVFHTVHEAGHIIGDVNHGNLYVATDATIKLIDTDSFQIRRGGKVWPCEVGVGTHQPPEMQDLASYKDVVRTSNHDAFGLAVIIFQLLCMGRHPFMGRYLGAGEPPDIPSAIALSRYAYARDSRRTQMSPGVGSLPIASLPDEIQAMFEAAFSPGAVRGGRPTPAAWGSALHRLGENLVRCRINSGHWFARATAQCPWCGVEAVTGAPLFPVVFVAGMQGSGIALLWQEILSVDPPAALLPLKEPDATGVAPSPEIAIERRAQRQRRIIAALGASFAAAAILFFMPEQGKMMPLLAVGAATAWFWNRPKAVASIDAAERLQEARDEWRQLEADWKSYAGLSAFLRVRQELDAIKHSHDALPEDRKKRLAELMSNRHASQLEQHLGRFAIAEMRIPGIGNTKVATLISYGICSAADIKPELIEPIPGFGPRTIANMIAARNVYASTFRFDPSRAIAPAEVMTLDQDTARRRLGIERDLSAGLLKLKAVAADATKRGLELDARAANNKRELAQALADARAARCV